MRRPGPKLSNAGGAAHGACLLLFIASIFCGCDDSRDLPIPVHPSEDVRPDLYQKATELPGRKGWRGDKPPIEGDAQPPAARYEVTVERVYYGQEGWDKLRLILKQLPAPSPEAVNQELWEANGLFAGRIRRSSVSPFFASVPGRMAVDRVAMMAGAAAEPVRMLGAAGDGGRYHVRTAVQVDELVRYRRGAEARWLMRLSEPGGMDPRLEFLPQVHQDAMSLQPRQPQEKMLDGWVGEDLKILPPMDGDQSLVIWAEHPAEIEARLAPPPEPAATERETAREAAQRQKQLEERMLMDPRLGPALLHGWRLNKPVRMVLVIHIMKLAAPEPAPRALKSESTRPD